jgi:hypothetical protein
VPGSGGAVAQDMAGAPPPPREQLDDLVLGVEAALVERGRAEGRETGARKAAAEARAKGRAKGLELGLEMGFYRGCLAQLARLGREELAARSSSSSSSSSSSNNNNNNSSSSCNNNYSISSSSTCTSSPPRADLPAGPEQVEVRRARELAHVRERLQRPGVAQVLETLLALVVSFPAGRALDDETHAHFLKIRAKFRVLEARLGLVLELLPELGATPAAAAPPPLPVLQY